MNEHLISKVAFSKRTCTFYAWKRWSSASYYYSTDTINGNT